MSTLSSAQIEAGRNEAEADIIMSAAEGKIAKWVKKRNQFNLSLQKIKNFDALADNEKVIISPTSDTDENTINVADAILEEMNVQSCDDDIASIAAEIDNLTKAAVVTPDK